MLGAVIGDVIGSVYEFHNIKTKEFPLWSKKSRFTDDTVMTVAVAEALLGGEGSVEERLISSMKKWGRTYPDAGYGGNFYYWLMSKESEPYGSYGNGSAMRVSAAGWLYDTIEETRNIARITAQVTHNHPEGIKGAEAVATAIYLARSGKDKQYIKEYTQNEFGYDLDFTLDDIRPHYDFDVSCQGSVPQAIKAFLEGQDFEDVIRLGVSIGGDTDTICAIVGSIAEAYYEIPESIKKEALRRLPQEMREILDRI